MQFRFKDNSGTVISLPDVTSLIRAIRDGLVNPETPFAVDDDRYWHRAETVAAYREAELVLRRLPAGHALLSAPRIKPRKGLRAWRLPPVLLRFAAIGLVAAIAVSIALRFWSPSRASAAPTASLPEASRAEQELVKQLTGDYGTAFARVVRQRQDWLQAQRLGQRFRGTALKTPESIRAVHQVSHRLRGGADSLVPNSDAVASRLVARAASMARRRSGLDGLTSSLEDQFSDWRTDIEAYAALQLELADGLDAVADFLLTHQQGFAIEEDRTFFLSRADATRYRELLDQLTVLVNRERAWGDAMDRRHPGWLSALPEGERPKPGRPILASK
ncbi:MAG TPA: hypothetical protein VGA78_10905 [Gemmatimonadales bacterium]|jgi:hypothetical protein